MIVDAAGLAAFVKGTSRYFEKQMDMPGMKGGMEATDKDFEADGRKFEREAPELLLDGLNDEVEQNWEVTLVRREAPKKGAESYSSGPTEVFTMCMHAVHACLRRQKT